MDRTRHTSWCISNIPAAVLRFPPLPLTLLSWLRVWLRACGCAHVVASRSGAHFDGGSLGGACKLTSILYVNEGWDGERDGGRLLMLDEPHGCWRSVTPHAGRVIFFLCEETLHKVEPCFRERFALTAWWFRAPTGEQAPLHAMGVVDSGFEPGDARRHAVFEREAAGGTEREVAECMRLPARARAYLRCAGGVLGTRTRPCLR